MKKRRCLLKILVATAMMTATVFTASMASAARSDVEAFVTRFYQIILNREPETAGLDGWVNALLEKQLTGSDLALAFVLSPEFKSRVVSDAEYLNMLYAAFFGRPPDTIGFNGWLSYLESGNLRELVLNRFIESLEFFNLSQKFGIIAAPPAAERFVSRFYALILGRAPDQKGLSGWAQALSAGTRTHEELAQGFVFSPEFANRNVGDEAYVRILYAAFFNRDPDGAGFKGWIDQLEGGVSREAALAGFTGSEEFEILIASFADGDGGGDGVLVDDLDFSDPLLAQCVQSEAAANGWRFADEVTSLDCSQANIRLLDGLQSLTNLSTLSLRGNRIADISHLNALENLSVLDLSAIPGLRNIDALLTLNALTAVNLSESGNGDISCANLDALSQKAGSVNPPDNCKQLITDVVFADTALQNCVMSSATQNGFTFTRELTTLNCDASGITQLDGIEAFKQLQSINFSENQVTDLTPLGQLRNLAYVYAAENPITDVSTLSELPALSVLDLSRIPELINIDVLLNSSTLNELSINDSGDGELSCSSLDNLSSQLDTVSRSPGCNMLIRDVVFKDPALEQCVLDKATTAGLTFTSELNNITCRDLGITDLSGMGEFVNVVALTFDNNQISDLGPLRNLLKLRGLWVNNNNITDFYALDHLAELRLIEARDNQALANINTIVYMGNLKFLDLRGSGTDQKISCSDLDKLSDDILNRQIGSPTVPPEFLPPETCNGASSTGLNAIAKADMNGDGLADILLDFDPVTIQGVAGLNSWQIATSADNQSQFFAGSLFAPLKPADVASAIAIAVADANDDGLDDLLLQVDKVDGSRVWQVLASEGTALVSYAGGVISLAGGDIGDDARAVAFTDINADGYADILIQAQGVTNIGLVSYHISFGSATGYAAPVFLYQFDQKLGRPEVIALEDINGDGTADLVFDRKRGTRHCFFSRTFQNGAFEPQSRKNECASLDLPPEYQIRAVGVADMTGNGQSELVISYVLGGRTEWSYYTHRQGESGTEWGYRQFFAAADAVQGTQRTIAVADLNKDGRADILNEVTLGTQKTWVAHIANDYSLSEAQTWLTGNSDSRGYKTLGLRDYNGDGFPDLMIDVPAGVADQRLYVKINDGINFESFGWSVWYQNAASPTVIGVEEEGLTTLAHDNSGLISRIGSTVKYTQNELRDELAGDGLSLQMPPTTVVVRPAVLKPNECRLVYDEPMIDLKNQSAKVSWGALVCSQKIGDHVTIEASVIYGECELKGNGGGLLDCNAGLFKDTLTVDLGAGAETEIVASGPNAQYCGGITSTGACAGVGADLVSGSGEISVGDSKAGIEAGIGFGATAGASLEDGVFAGKLGGKFIGGVTVEVAVDLKPIYKISEDAYLFVEDNGEKVVLAAGSEVIDAVNSVGNAGEEVAEVVAGEAVYIAEQGADAAVVVFTFAGESVVDIVNGIEAGLVDASGEVVDTIDDIGNGIVDGIVDVWDSIF